jgi:hypothetical protein
MVFAMTQQIYQRFFARGKGDALRIRRQITFIDRTERTAEHELVRTEIEKFAHIHQILPF